MVLSNRPQSRVSLPLSYTGLLFGSGIVISSLKSRVLAADGSSSSVAQNDSATFSDNGVEKEEDEEEVGGAYDAVTASSYDEAVVEASDYDEASNSVGGMDQSLVPVALASSDQVTQNLVCKERF